MEAYWGLIRLGAATKIERDDVLQCVCGNRKRQTDPLWDTGSFIRKRALRKIGTVIFLNIR